MTFRIEDNRITINDSAGETVFDTDTPMPTIIQWGTTGKGSTWPDVQLINSDFLAGHIFDNFTAEESFTTYRKSSYFGGNLNCGTFKVVDPFTNLTWYETDYVTPEESTYWAGLHPKETVQSKYIGETGAAGVDADFFIVTGGLMRAFAYEGQLDASVYQAYGSYPVDKPWQEDYGVIQTTLPPAIITPITDDNGGYLSHYLTYPASMNFSGSTLLETAFTGKGEQWLTRLLSLRYQAATSQYGGSLWADWIHSSNGFEGDAAGKLTGTCSRPKHEQDYGSPRKLLIPAGWTFGDNPVAGNFQSAYFAYFNYYFGKFTI